jgi:hypothetical protein
MDLDYPEISFHPSDGDGAQVLDTFYPRALSLLPEIRIMYQLIKNSILERDITWINRDEPEYLYSFQNCCEYLGIDYRAARKVLNRVIGKGRRVVIGGNHRGRPAGTILKPSDIGDIPGKTYTHRYGECLVSSRCPECRQRYNYVYCKTLRKTARTRSKIAALFTGGKELL